MFNSLSHKQNYEQMQLSEILDISLETNTDGPWPDADCIAYRKRAKSLIKALSPLLDWLDEHKNIRITGPFVCIGSHINSIQSLVSKKIIPLRSEGAQGDENIFVEDLPQALIRPLKNYLESLPGYDRQRQLSCQENIVKQHIPIDYYICAAFNPPLAMEFSLDWPEDPEIDVLVQLNGQPSATVEFLTSAFGHGYTATIYGWRGDYDPVDGWCDDAYYSLAGVARFPSANECSDEEWLFTVKQRLLKNGVVLLDEEDTETYLKTEGRYWRTKLRPRQSTPLLQLSKSTLKPRTPISDSAEELAAAVSLLRSHRHLPTLARFWHVGPRFYSKNIIIGHPVIAPWSPTDNDD